MSVTSKPWEKVRKKLNDGEESKTRNAWVSWRVKLGTKPSGGYFISEPKKGDNVLFVPCRPDEDVRWKKPSLVYVNDINENVIFVSYV